MSGVARQRLGGTDVQLSALGLGAAPIGNLYTEVDEADALAAVAGAFEAGIRHFDTAPYYGYGLSEARLGRGLAGVPRADYTLSTKVGRCIYDDAHAAAGRDGFAVAGRRAEFDYSADGVRRAFASSLERLGTDYIDVLLHDIGALTHGDNHANVLRQALEEALPAMAELKAAGACGAIGLGVNEQDVALEVLPRFPLDCVMLAGRYTLLEQHGARALLQQAQQRNVAILSAGPYSSGLLSDARGPGATYNYAPVDTATLQHAQRLYAACAAFGVDIGAAALQFPLAHPAVTTVVAGMRTVAEVRSAATRLAAPVPSALWQRLRDEGLLAAELPTP
ncbi:MULTISPECIES: aldo/keto reductase [Xanthomonas]|uniref:aldo/keto reductase n=1 Tax=Xanthomonas TaxID=338 RepID=UPI0006E72406|nr:MULTISPECIES: aldo/keto reductase [Xanthomonas]MBO9747369.1 aldo/keto reductase [Xanthomonas phaseoli pv. dieffenbachiae]MBO9751923.1 aldo/keto reductase [Xanthomonas phaseoli pv. dieffenbachiae]MBO9878148.1 aldo/keto reductase [Xanthomonas sp. D-99]MBO9891140.1 aldo/keto reductase [Xanthomonas sp. D-36-1]OQP83299.1 oxidoreductase [Xanthomonas citri]